MLNEIIVSNCRNIRYQQHNFHPRLNLILGDNGVGKTSLLEAIYMLGCGYSFRTRENSPLINREQEQLTLFGRLSSGQTIGIEKNRQSKTRVKINSEFCQSSSILAEILPIQVIHQDIFQVIDAGPSVRRALLDWGMFHVKHEYFYHWKRYVKALKQRNALLKSKVSDSEILPWTKLLIEHGTVISSMREEYFGVLNDRFVANLDELSDLNCSLSFYKGWDRKETELNLEQSLYDNYSKDSLRGFTQYGPHQADILISVDTSKAKHNLSRGQQKLVLMALKLAQIQIFNKPLLFLIDDFSAELDSTSRRLLSKALLASGNQLFITGIEEYSILDFLEEEHAMFHVKH